MADAKICDHCGDYFDDSEDRDMHLTTKTVVSLAIKRERSKPTNVSTKPIIGKTETKEIDAYDLCDDCYAGLKEWWENGDQVGDGQ